MMLDIENLVTKAQESYDKRNYGYAIELGRQVLEIDPSHTKSRQIVRASTIKNFEIQGAVPKGILAALKGFIPLIKITFHSLIGKNSDKISRACESYLAKNPLSIWGRTKLAEALQQMNFLDSAINEFESTLALNPRNINALKSLGALYNLKKDIKKAEQYYKKVMAAKPDDLEAPRALKDLAALSTMQEGGWDKARTARDMLKDKTTATDLEKGSQLVKEGSADEEIARLNSQLQQDPQNILNYKKLGELYMKKKDYQHAQEIYQKATQVNPSDASLPMRLGDIKILFLDQKLRQTQKQLAAKPNDPQLKQAFNTARTEKVKFQVEEYRRRVQAHPTDMGLHFQLGAALYAARQIDEAITEFQTAVRDPRRRIDSYNYLGRSFMLKKHCDLAVTQFNKALEAGTLTSDQTKTLRYNLAAAHEANGNPEKALAEYKTIMETDFSYKDVAKKVEKLQKK